MGLNAQQLAAIKAGINADAELAAFPNNSDGAFSVAALLNQTASPAFYIWRDNVPVNEIMTNGFDWTRVDNLTIGKARIWDWMMQTNAINPSLANVRAGILAVFATAGDLATRLAIFGHCQRAATRAEKLLATGPGTTTSEQGVGPATSSFYGNLSYQDVQEARNS